MKYDIIGAGVAGCGAALELAEKNKVTLWERNNTLLSGSSDATPCRLGIFHYPDLETALICLDTTISMVRKYPGFKVVDEKPEAYLIHSYYFVVKESKYSAEQVLSLFNIIQSKYAKRVQEDTANKVFGEPEQLITILNPIEYAHLIDISKVLIGIRTAECSFNWPKLKDYLKEKILAHPNIEVNINSEIIDAKHSDTDAGFILTIKNTQTPSILQQKTDFIINASWQNIEDINRMLGFHMRSDIRTNRTKVMIEVLLPKSLEKVPSMFFCFGSFCSYTNLGERKGLITYEPVTNIEQSTGYKISSFSERLLRGEATKAEKLSYGTEIIQGISQFIPHMAQAQFVRAKFGNVKTRDVQFDTRREDGVEEQQLCLISNGSVKFTHFVKNAEKVYRLAAQHEETSNKLQEEIIPEINKVIKSEYPKTITHFFTKYLQRYVECCELKTDESVKCFKGDMSKTVKFKQAINAQIKKGKARSKHGKFFG